MVQFTPHRIDSILIHEFSHTFHRISVLGDCIWRGRKWKISRQDKFQAEHQHFSRHFLNLDRRFSIFRLWFSQEWIFVESSRYWIKSARRGEIGRRNALWENILVPSSRQILRSLVSGSSRSVFISVTYEDAGTSNARTSRGNINHIRKCKMWTLHHQWTNFKAIYVYTYGYNFEMNWYNSSRTSSIENSSEFEELFTKSYCKIEPSLWAYVIFKPNRTAVRFGLKIT